MGKSRIFLYFCLAFVGGIFMASLFFVPQIFMLVILVLGVFLFFLSLKYGRLMFIGFFLLFFVLGIWRHQLAESSIVYPREGNIEFIGMVAEEPEIRPTGIKLTIKCNEKCSRYIRYILVTTNRYPEYKYGDKLRISGSLKNPPIFDDFNYRDYLKKDGIVAVMDFPEIELLGSGFGNPVMKVLFSFKDKFRDTARSFISPPQEGFLEALVFGDESGISKEWKDKLNLTGTRHIAAVSGMNITIISTIVFSFIVSLGLRKSAAFYLSISFLFFYILMIGAPASAIRAFIMGFIWLLAQKAGRPASSGSRAVFFAAAFMLAQNPFLLTKDIGFQLSFLAILGLICLQPFFVYWLRRIPNPKIFPIRTTLAATFSAQVFTLPILVYNFGYFSPISFIPNVLIVPALAPVTILIIIFGVFGMIFGPFGFILSWLVWLSLTYIIKIIDWFSFALASLAVENLHWIWLIVSYLFLGGFVWWYNKHVWKYIKGPGW